MEEFVAIGQELQVTGQWLLSGSGHEERSETALTRREYACPQDMPVRSPPMVGTSSTSQYVGSSQQAVERKREWAQTKMVSIK